MNYKEASTIIKNLKPGDIIMDFLESNDVGEEGYFEIRYLRYLKRDEDTNRLVFKDICCTDKRYDNNFYDWEEDLLVHWLLDKTMVF